MTTPRRRAPSAGRSSVEAAATPARPSPRVRPLRVDAARNRARILEAAEQVFAARGTTASTEEVAAAAELGIGTVFRHFATKEALLLALLVQRIERVTAEAERRSEDADAGESFFDFLRWLMRQDQVSKKHLLDALAATGSDVRQNLGPAAVPMRASIAELLARAQAAGAVRRDAGVADVLALAAGASRVAEHLSSSGASARDHALTILFDGLRSERSPGRRAAAKKR